MSTEEKKAEQKDVFQQPQKTTENKPTVDNANVPAKKTPSLPKKLLDAGFATVLLQPKQAFIAAGGTDQQFAREVNFAAQLLMDNEYLFKCAQQYPDNFVESIKNIALTGLTLNPELRLSYLVPYKGKVKFQSSYMGKVDILTRSGVVRMIEANLVYDKDTFKVIKGLNPELVHEPDYFNASRGAIKGGYWIAVLPNGQKKFDVMPLSRIDDIKQRSEAVKSGKGSPWDTDFEEMAKKTIINWAFKSLPKSGLSDDMVKVLEIEGQFEREEFDDWKKTQQPKDKFNEEPEFTDAVVIE